MEKRKKIIIILVIAISFFFSLFLFYRKSDDSVKKQLENLNKKNSYSVRIDDGDEDKQTYEINENKKYMHYQNGHEESFFLDEKRINKLYNDSSFIEMYYYVSKSIQKDKKESYKEYVTAFHDLFHELSNIKYKKEMGTNSYIKEVSNKKINAALAILTSNSIKCTDVSKVIINKDKKENLIITFECKKNEKYVLNTTSKNVDGVLPKKVTDSLKSTSSNTFAGIYTDEMKCENNKTLKSKLILSRFSPNVFNGFGINFEVFIDCSEEALTSSIDDSEVKWDTIEDWYEIDGEKLDYSILGSEYHLEYDGENILIVNNENKTVKTLKKNYSPSMNFQEITVEKLLSFDDSNSIVYFGLDDYKNQKDYLSKVLKIQNELNTDIYYINVSKLTANEKEQLREQGIILSDNIGVSVGYEHYLNGKHSEEELKEFIEKYYEN